MRAYQPRLFVGDGYSDQSRFKVDRNVVFGISGLIALALGVWMFFPSMQKIASRQPSAKVESNGAIVDQFKSKVDLSKYTRELNADSNPLTPSDLSWVSNVPITQSSAPYSMPGNQVGGSQPRIAPLVSTVEEVNTTGGFEAQAHQSFGDFLARYCRDRALKTGSKIKPTSIMWLPGGSGAVVSFSESGRFRQGTAQYALRSGWAWIVSPDSDNAEHHY